MPLGQYAANIVKTDMFDQKTYYKTIFGQHHPYQIRISPNVGRTHGGADTAITGVMSNKININMEAEYDDLDLGGMVSNLPLVGGFLNSVGNVAGTAFATTGQGINNVGLFTRKFYKKGGYLRIEPEFKIVDWDGTGLTILSAAYLLNYCVPNRGETLDSIDNVVGEIGKVIGLEENAIGRGVNFVKNGVRRAVEGIVSKEDANKINEVVSEAYESNSTAKKIGDSVVSGVKTILDEGLQMTSSPTPVSVHISNYFTHHDMIIESVGVEFSDKITKAGPIQADFKVALSSREASTVDRMGLHTTNNRRVFFGTQSDVDGTGV